MAEDIRLRVGFLGHHKTEILRYRLGADGVLSLIQLWSWCASEPSRTTGDLAGLSPERIAIAARWHLIDRDADKFVGALVEAGFLDGEPGAHRLHDWSDHQPWVSTSQGRSMAGKKGRHEQISAAGRCGGGTPFCDDRCVTIKKSTKSKAVGQAPAVAQDLPGQTPAPSPSPSPSPSPTPTPTPTPTPATPAGGGGASMPLVEYFQLRGWDTSNGNQAKIEALGAVPKNHRDWVTHEIKSIMTRKRVNSPVGLWLRILAGEQGKGADGFIGMHRPRPTTGWVPATGDVPDYDKGLVACRDLMAGVFGGDRRRADPPAEDAPDKPEDAP